MRVEGQLVFNGTAQMLNAALAGFGLAYVRGGDRCRTRRRAKLRRVLADWCPPFSGYHLFYPSRRQSSPPSPCWSMRCATGARSHFAPSMIGTVSMSLRDLTIFSVVALNFLKWGASRCALYAASST